MNTHPNWSTDNYSGTAWEIEPDPEGYDSQELEESWDRIEKKLSRLNRVSRRARKQNAATVEIAVKTQKQ